MYLPSHFQITDRELMIELIRQYSFGTLVTSFQNKLEINQAPFLVDQEGKNIFCHLAKANMHWDLITDAEDLKVCFSGPDSYISPNWYLNPVNNVPTWNFIHLQVSGRASLLNEGELLVLLEQLTQKHEAEFEQPWTIDKMSEKKLKAMLKAIVGIKISIDDIQGKAKLSQNKPKEDLESLIKGLKDQDKNNAQQIAYWMKKDLN